MNFELPKIYPITDRRISGLSHAEQAKRLIAGGATLIQLREKYLSPDAFYDEAQEAVALARRHGVTIIINDRVDIALAIGADGVHVGQDDLSPDEARRLLGPDAIIGFSTHTLEQMITARQMPVDYIAFGPVFSTATKENQAAIVGFEMLSSVRKVIENKPLVAIGGIDVTNVKSVLSSGADSAAVISSILKTPDRIAENLQEMLKTVQQR